MNKRIDKSKACKLCYLCGKGIQENESRDHVPPKQFYAEHIRTDPQIELFTLTVHHGCNTAYQKDEDYFVHSLAPLTKDTKAGSELMQDIIRRAKRPESKKIIQMIYKEFDSRPSGLYLPSWIVLKRYDGKRIRRVIWKILRGLYFKETGRFLPESVEHPCEIVSPGYPPKEAMKYVLSAPSRGDYPGVFDYKHIEKNKINIWAILFWDTIIAFIAFDFDVSAPKQSGPYDSPKD